MDAWDAAAPASQAASRSVDEWDAAAPSATPAKAASAETPWYQNVPMGALSGASKIGATILQPLDWARDVVMGDRAGGPSTNQARRQSLGEFFKENADPNSVAFKGGQLGAEVAGTAGVGPALGAGATAMGAPAAVGAALGSGGLSLGGASMPLAANLGL